MMLDIWQTQAIFLFEFKMGCKAAEITHNNDALGPGTTNKHTMQSWFKKFCRDKCVVDVVSCLHCFTTHFELK